MTTELLRLDGVHTYYGHVHALKGINLEVHKGEIVALLGSNGAGKSTTLHTIVGLAEPRSGDVYIAGERTAGVPPHRIVRRGVALVPEGRHIFPNLSVRENLLVGGYPRAGGNGLRESEEFVYQLFPVLGDRPGQPGSSLSGGEQQMLAIGRALMSAPEILLLDEPSLGLAPLIARDIFRTIHKLPETQGMTVLLVEQNARQALRVASRAYVMEVGQIVHQGPSEELIADDTIRRAYLGA